MIDVGPPLPLQFIDSSAMDAHSGQGQFAVAPFILAGLPISGGIMGFQGLTASAGTATVQGTAFAGIGRLYPGWAAGGGDFNLAVLNLANGSVLQSVAADGAFFVPIANLFRVGVSLVGAGSLVTVTFTPIYGPPPWVIA